MRQKDVIFDVMTEQFTFAPYHDNLVDIATIQSPKPLNKGNCIFDNY